MTAALIRRDVDTEMCGEKTVTRHREKAAIPKPSREASLPALVATNSADTLISDSQPPEL